MDILNTINSFVWGPPLMVLLIGTGILLTVRLGLLQVIKLPTALKLIFTARNTGNGDINSFKALCTALAATVGTGNIVGVATAIKAGGPGALFWMWMAAFFGMATKYAEGVLAVKYRTVDANGNISGGPMHYIEQGLGKKYKPLAVMFSVFGVMVACLGSGTFTQVNAIVEITNLSIGIPVDVYGSYSDCFGGNRNYRRLEIYRDGSRKNSAIYGVSLYAYYSGSTDRICRSGTCSICSYH